MITAARSYLLLMSQYREDTSPARHAARRGRYRDVPEDESPDLFRQALPIL